MARTLESAVKKKVKEILTDFRAFYFMPATGGYGKSGVPDIVGCVNGKFFAIECKAGGRFLTALQKKCITDIDIQNGKVWVVNEERLKDFKLEFWRWAHEQN